MSLPDARLALLENWVTRELRLPVQRIEPASSDASFRRYFRVLCQPRSYVVMDAPPPHEDVRPYLKVSGLLEALGTHVPHVFEADIDRGLLLLEDLGSTQYLPLLRSGMDPQALYGAALEALAHIQVHGAAACAQLAPYGERELQREMGLMPEWFLGRHLQLTATAADVAMLDATRAFLVKEALAQPPVFVHRDYHSRNLMVVPDRSPGVIDFQDALRGPAGYDLVSLLKDCYIGWARERVLNWVRQFRARLLALGGQAGADEADFVRGFDLIGVQRHLKVLGIFCRLWYRDGKPGYLNDLPLTLDYVRDTCARYRELHGLGEFLEQQVVPRLAPANARSLAEPAASVLPAGGAA
ncbi:MAG: phosphotransferase [Proteobacteria bacterium]|nr:phosphotransferase [Pseudomonadota bacterium]